MAQHGTADMRVKRRGMIAGAALLAASLVASRTRDAGASAPTFTLNNDDATTNVGTVTMELAAGTGCNGSLLLVDGTTAGTTNVIGVTAVEGRGHVLGPGLFGQGSVAGSPGVRGAGAERQAWVCLRWGRGERARRRSRAVRHRAVCSRLHRPTGHHWLWWREQ